MKTIKFAVFTLFLVVLMSSHVFARRHHLKHKRQPEAVEEKKAEKDTPALVKSKVTVDVKKPQDAVKEVVNTKTEDEVANEKEAENQIKEIQQLDENNLEVINCNQTVNTEVKQMVLDGEKDTNRTIHIKMNKNQMEVSDSESGEIIKVLNMTYTVKQKQSIDLCQQMEFELETMTQVDVESEQKLEICFHSAEQQDQFNSAVQKLQACHLGAEPAKDLAKEIKNVESETVLSKPHDQAKKGPAEIKAEKVEQQPSNLLEKVLVGRGMQLARGDANRAKMNVTVSKPRDVTTGFLIRRQPVDLFANN